MIEEPGEWTPCGDGGLKKVQEGPRRSKEFGVVFPRSNFALLFRNLES